MVQKHQKELCAGLCHYKKQAVTVLSGPGMLNQELAVKCLQTLSLPLAGISIKPK